jgi:conjugative transfer signal peptidase TraF
MTAYYSTRIVGIVTIAILSVFAAATPSLRSVAVQQGLRFNSTPSVPVGIYQTASNGNLVSFCVKEPYASLALKRGYRHHSNFQACPDHGEPLLKSIVAVSGDRVSLSPMGVWVNGRKLRNSAPLRLDSGGRTLPGYPFGTYVTGSGQAWVINQYNAKSFDSRYYGPILVSDIREHLTPVLVWE